VAIDNQLTNFPVEPSHILPTQLGNILRSAEEYPYHKYGLEIITVWPRLWLVLPAEVKQELAQARHQLDLSARFFAWAILFAGWFILTSWAILISLFMAIMAYKRVLYSAGVYGELLRATFDLHRFKLYEDLHQPLSPESNEHEHGLKLTAYLEQRIFT
jgi:hypothetical protein